MIKILSKDAAGLIKHVSRKCINENEGRKCNPFRLYIAIYLDPAEGGNLLLRKFGIRMEHCYVRAKQTTV
jgi:hypothetical protein